DTAALGRSGGTDFLGLDELLSDGERALRDRVRAFCDDEVLPVINGYWERAEFPFELVPRLAGLGIAGGTLQGHGCAGLSALAGDGNVAGFVVEKGTAGCEPEVITGKTSKRAVLQADIRLRSVRVPLDHRLAESRSFRDTGRVLGPARLSVAWEALGHAVAVY